MKTFRQSQLNPAHSPGSRFPRVLGQTLPFDRSSLRRLRVLHRSTMVAVSITLLGLLSAVYWISATLLNHSLQTAEDQTTRQAMESVVTIFQQTYADFEARFPDWSAWDDTYAFMSDRNPAYISSNLAAEALSSMNVHFVMYLDPTGQLVYGTSVDPDRREKKPLSPIIRSRIGAGSALLRSVGHPHPISGMMVFGEQPMLVTAQPILTSQGKGPIRGTLIFGRVLDTARIQKLTHRYPLRVYRVGDPDMPTDFAAAERALEPQADSQLPLDASSVGTTYGPSILVRSLNPDRMSAYAVLNDLSNQPALTLRVDVPREFYRQQQVHLQYLLISLIIIGIIFWLIALRLLEKQSGLYRQVQRLNNDLETQVYERTLLLTQALDFEALLKRITDKVRDSIDETQILHTAVQELTTGLGLRCCDTALYNLEQEFSTLICVYESASELPNAQGAIIPFALQPEVYRSLMEGHHVHFCQLQPSERRPFPITTAILACPILDDRGVLGDLWLYGQPDWIFSETEIRLVQQVVTQCAIAIRQARLYQATQEQVSELERLNRLKDDFLSTVSHELRTPMASIKMAIQMLEISLKTMSHQGEQSEPDYIPQPLSPVSTGGSRVASSSSQGTLQKSQSSRVERYFKILHDECEREIRLINDLLDLSRLEAGGETLIVSTIEVQPWLTHLAEPFTDRTQRQHQRLYINIADDLPILKTDLSKLERILNELLNNACKYTPAGEAIEVSVTLDPSQLGVATNSTPSAFCFTITNSGVELPSDELTRIFEKFYRIPNNDPWKHGGTGLGLALVRKLVVYLSGSIHVESANQQINFVIRLPNQS